MSPRTLLRSLTAGHTARRVGLLLALVVGVLAVLSLVLLSPAALAAFNPDGNADWQRLANISQTYAAASAVLALLALGGVAVSLVFQAREMKAARTQALRQVHMDLIKMAMDEPLYLPALGPSGYPDDDQRRQHMYANLLVAYWQMAYEMGDLTEVPLRAEAARIFAGDVSRRYWQNAREARMRSSTDKRARRFHEILDEEYQKATRPPPPPEPVAPEPDAPAAPSGQGAPGWPAPDRETPYGEGPEQESPGSAS